MPSVKRLHQVFLRAESQEGVAGSAAQLFTAANANLLVIDPFLNVAKENFARSNVNRPSVSPLQPLAGLTTGEGGFGVELTTTKSTSAPGWGLAMQACGMRQETLYAQPIDSITPASGFEAIGAGERLVQATSGAIAYLVHTVRDGSTPDTHAFMRLVSGTPNANAVWTSSDSGGAFTADGTFTDIGFCWTPATFGYQTSTCGAVDATVNVGEIVTGVTTGAVGVVVAGEFKDDLVIEGIELNPDGMHRQGFVAGFSYANVWSGVINTATATSTEGQGFDAGIAYTTGPLSFSLNGYYGEEENLYTVADDDTYLALQGSVRYELGQGIAVAGSLGWTDFDDEAAADNEGVYVTGGVLVEF